MTATGWSVCCVSTSGKLTESDRRGRTTATIRVLLADDDKRYAAALRVLIEEQPELTVVALAYDGLETHRAAPTSWSPDAVVVDLHMPNMDGVTAIRKLREAHPLVCLIALTGDESPAIHDEATNARRGRRARKGQMLEALVERLRNARERDGEGRNRTGDTTVSSPDARRLGRRRACAVPLSYSPPLRRA